METSEIKTMLNEREALWRLLLGGEDVARSAAQFLDETNGWSSAVQLAAQWKALPNLSDKLSSLKISLSGDARVDLRDLSTRSFLRSSVVTRRGVEALDALAGRGISVAAFKGLAVLGMGNGERDSRTLQDVDLLVSEPDVIPAVRVLEAAGYRCAVPGDLRDYFRFVQRSPGFSGNEAILLTSPEGADVDLHWRVGGRNSERFESPAVLSRSRVANLKGRTVRVIGTVDGALLTVHHSLRNNFVPDEMVRDLSDLEAWLTRLQMDGELGLFAEAARESSLLSATLAMAAILSRVKSGEVLSAAIEALRSEGTPKMESAARQIEELFFIQLRDGPLNPDILYLLRSDAWRLILSGAIGGWSRYREQMQALEIRKHGVPMPLADRLHRLWRSVLQTRRSHWAYLRTLAQAKG